MPVIRNFHCEDLPAWAEVKKIEHILLPFGATHVLHTGCKKCAVLVYRGKLNVTDDKGNVTKLAGFWRPSDTHCFDCGDLTLYSPMEKVGNWFNKTDIYVFAGDFGDWFQISSFACESVDKPINYGQPVDYEFNTNMPNHYTEYDDYWICIKGHGKVTVDGETFMVHPGDGVVAKRGTYHQVSTAMGYMVFVTFGSRLGGKKRTDMLWESEHGKPECD